MVCERFALNMILNIASYHIPSCAIVVTLPVVLIGILRMVKSGCINMETYGPINRTTVIMMTLAGITA